MSEVPAANEQTSKKYFDRLDIPSATVAALIAIPFFILFAVLGEKGKGIIASVVVVNIVLNVWMRWDLRRFAWLWVVISVIFLAHIPLVLMVPWSNSGPYSRFTMLPGALLDFVVVYNFIRLTEKWFGEKLQRHPSES